MIRLEGQRRNLVEAIRNGKRDGCSNSKTTFLRIFVRDWKERMYQRIINCTCVRVKRTRVGTLSLLYYFLLLLLTSHSYDSGFKNKEERETK